MLIEKPACGDFLPIVDGGFSLQYSPLMEYREGRGMILFCQLDVTGRTEPDPPPTRSSEHARYVSNWKPTPRRKAVYSGEPAGQKHLESAGISVSPYDGGALAADQVLIVGPGGGRKLAGSSAAIADWLKSGGHLLAIGIDQQDADALSAREDRHPESRAHRLLLRTVQRGVAASGRRACGRLQSRSAQFAAYC